MIARTLLLLALSAPLAHAQPRLEASAKAKIGSDVAVAVSGTGNPRDFLAIVPKGSREGAYESFQYVGSPGVVTLVAPTKPGTYEIRLLGAGPPYPTLARMELLLEAATATLDAPAQVAAGAKVQVAWTGPNNARDYVGIGDADPKGTRSIGYVYTAKGSPVTLSAPDRPGDYELRYFLAAGDTIIASRKIMVGNVAASVSAPAQVGAGRKFNIEWKGPGNPGDFITIVKTGAHERQYADFAYLSKGNPIELRAPDAAGDYEVRYLTAQSYSTLASARVTVAPVRSTLKGPPEAVAGSTFSVDWSGPNNPNDYVAIVARGAREGEGGNYQRTASGNPVSLLAPLAPGEYELRYNTGQSHMTLARVFIRILPGRQEAGFIEASTGAAMPGGGAVEVILDASGSMLLRIGAERRIDIAKRTLTKLTSTLLPAGTPFALRVFGREVDSCQTDLDIPLAPLDPAAVATRIRAIQVKNMARTPIGASLEKVAQDLAEAKGGRLVLLLTDGEETCGGDAGAAIKKLTEGAIATRVNIIGLAIDDKKLEATFRHWAESGNGSYFNASNAAGLTDAVAMATRPGFEVVNVHGQVVVAGVAGGEPVRAMPGTYTVRLKGQPGQSQAVTVKPKETSRVSF